MCSLNRTPRQRALMRLHAVASLLRPEFKKSVRDMAKAQCKRYARQYREAKEEHDGEAD